MASLKEVKTRIASVNSTRKITSAMKMVASSKLHRAEQSIAGMRPYEKQLGTIMQRFVAGMRDDISSPFAAVRPVSKVALVVFSSNSSLCGGFNLNVIKLLKKTIEQHKADGHEVELYPIGRKVTEAVRKMGYEVATDHAALLEHPDYAEAAAVAKDLMQKFADKQLDKVELIYHQFKNTATQILQYEDLLPVTLTVDSKEPVENVDYIVEPSVAELVDELLPKTLQLKLYTALLDSIASEHAARVVAMQVATDNADDLLRDLTLMYNKTRQQAITTELLDIVGGSMQ